MEKSHSKFDTKFIATVFDSQNKFDTKVHKVIIQYFTIMSNIFSIDNICLFIRSVHNEGNDVIRR
jgi:hypothetical protein